jgi:2-dehydro-3-deoxygluconokinase
VLGVEVPQADVTAGTLASTPIGRPPSGSPEFGVARVAVTLRESLSASDNAWSAVLFDGRARVHQSQRYVVRLVDRIGGGDSFAAG